MICPNCGTQNEAGRKFCGECGTRLAATCPSCGAANVPGTKFCGECGTRLTDVAGLPAGAQPSRTPSAERRLVSILFADLVGFTTLAENRDAEEVRELLSRYFETCREVVARYGGTVEKFIGDAVMAVWGTPVAHEDDAERAVRAALELVSAVPRLRSGEAAGAQADDSAIRLRAAVITGEAAVTVGAVGEGLVAGDLVNTASRLQSVAPPGTVLVGEATQRAAAAGIGFEPAGPQLLKGKSASVPAWRALGVIAGVGGKGRQEGPEPPFVGRDDELRLLKELYHATVRERRSRLVSIHGQAGIGKSRLVWELEKYLDGLVEQLWWHTGRSPAYGEGITFWALGEMVRHRAGIAETDDPATTRQRLSAILAEHLPDPAERRWVEPRLAALLGLEEMPSGEREELFAAWRTLFQRLADTNPVVMVFEDIQWADHGLLDFIEYLLAAVRSEPILIVTLARPELFERRPTWGAGLPSFTSLALEPLQDAAMRELLEGYVPGLPAAAIASIVERAAGVPLYAVETVRMLIDQGQLVRDGDRYQVEASLEHLAVPETLQALISARLDGLDPAQRSLLQAAAVLGQSFTTPALGAVAGLEAADLEPILVPLVGRQLLMVERDPRSPERGQYKFTQGLVREVAYQTLARRDRRDRHLAAARYFEALGDEEIAGVLASHYLDAYRATPAGEEADALAAQARVSLRAAADRAAALHSYRQALAYTEQALEVTVDPREAAATHLLAARLAFSAALNEQTERHLALAAEGHEKVADRAGLAKVRALEGEYLVTTRRLDGLRMLERTLPQFGDLADDPAVIRMKAELARVYMLEDRLAEAAAMTEEVLAAAGPLSLTDIVAEALITRGPAISALGRWHEAMAIMRGAVHLAEQQRHYATALRGRNNLASTIGYDSPAELHGMYLESLALAERLGLQGWAMYFVGTLGNLSIDRGDWDEWLNLLEGRDPKAGGFEFWYDMLRSAILSARGDHARAAELAAAADPEARKQGAAPAAHAEWLAGWRRLAAGDAVGAYEAALRAAQNQNLLMEGSGLAVRAAVWLRDSPRIAKVLDQLAASPTRTGKIGEVLESYAAGGAAAIAGRAAEARRQLLAAVSGLNEMDLRVDAALTALELTGLLGTRDPEIAAAEAEGRAFLERERASALIAAVDALPPAIAGQPKAERAAAVETRVS